MSKRLKIVPGISRSDAQAWIRAHHDHNDPPIGDLFRLGASDSSGRIVGVAIVGRPIARALQDGWTVEVLRVAVRRDLDPWGTRRGYPGACSFLYAASWRAARALGYRRAVTYTLDSESGASLRALAGWTPQKATEARGWGSRSVQRRRRDLAVSMQDKRRWMVCADYNREQVIPSAGVENVTPHQVPMFGGSNG